MSFFSPVSSACSSSSCHSAVNSHLRHEFRMCVFGAEQWNTYFGDVGIEPPLPPDVNEKLANNCPFWEGKKVNETHMLLLIPKTLYGNAVTIGTIAEIVQSPKISGFPIEFSHMESGFAKGRAEYLDTPVQESYWILITKNVLEETTQLKGEHFSLKADHKAPRLDMVAAYEGYQVPTLLEITTAILMHYVRTGEKLFNAATRGSYTYCRDDFTHIKHGLVVGFPASPITVVGGWGIKSEGLEICYDRGRSNLCMSVYTGAAAAYKM